MQSPDLADATSARPGDRPAARPGVVRIGTRGSRLAVTQSRWVQAQIAAHLGARPHEVDEAAPLVIITTTGDRIQDRRLLEVGGKALFTKEIEAALLEGRIDCAVHSAKDLAAEGPGGLTLAAFPEREDPRDALVTLAGHDVAALPPGARVGTASLRRQAQLLHLRPDLQIELLRGNVDTRLKRLEAGEMDAIVLALAGLKRLGLADRPLTALDPQAAPPAPAQGALAVQTRTDDARAAFARALDHAPTRLAVAAERGALEALEGSCRTAMGAHARPGPDGDLLLTVEALAPDGSARWRREGACAPNLAAAHALGRALGQAVRDAAGDRLEWMGHD